MISPYFIFVGLAFSLYGAFHYLRDTIQGKVKPNKMTWFMWSIAPFIAFAAEIHQGVGLQSLTTFIFGFNPLMIFIASFVNKKAYWKLGTFDVICGLLSLVGLLLWYLTKTSTVAIIFSISADLVAGIPTLKKSFFAPETENYKAFLGGLINTLITLLTVTTWNIDYIGFPLYVMFFNTIAVILIKYRIGKKFAYALR